MLVLIKFLFVKIEEHEHVFAGLRLFLITLSF